MADDFSNDGTWEWLKEISKKDNNVKIYRNTGPTRLGHTVLHEQSGWHRSELCDQETEGSLAEETKVQRAGAAHDGSRS